MSKVSLILLPDTREEWEVVSEPIKADGWYGCRSGIHTVSAYLNSFVGSLVLEATLMIEPKEGDWFTVYSREFPNKEYPNEYNQLGTSATVGFNIDGNYTMIRARIDRSKVNHGLKPDGGGLGIVKYGYVDQILINF